VSSTFLGITKQQGQWIYYYYYYYKYLEFNNTEGERGSFAAGDEAICLEGGSATPYIERLPASFHLTILSLTRYPLSEWG
jgi:hypothetical protein